VRRSFLPRRNYWMTIENPSEKAFFVVLLLFFYLGAFVQMIDCVSLFLEEERKRHIF
jgi:hypothetical protein